YNLQNGQLPPGFFEKANLGFSIFDLIGNFRFHRIMSKFFDGDFRSSPSAHVRRISPSSEQQREQWQGPTPWHIDGQYHNPRHFGLNFWVPLNTCGIEAPGLRIIRANVFDMQRYVEYDPVEETFNAGRLKTINETVFDDFEEGQIFAPELKVGDVFLFHNWTIHQTNCQDGMTKPRKSCELRVIQDAWTFPEGGSC
ncbi:MAG: phytanoyl-CoA dioxygenase family protein, partial [Rhodospirillaceae bacterium]|nr:phytanoyl-CoA dioxygenase family protein [Rhodospirillaceae bacterium]